MRSYRRSLIQEVLYSFRRLERKRHPREPGVLWVTDLISCPLKYEYEIAHPDLVSLGTYDPHFILGDLVHLGLLRLLFLARKQGLFAVNLREEIEGYKKLEVDEEEIVLKGRLDVLLESEEGKIGYEIKYSRSDAGIPRDNHRLQASLYAWLFDLDQVRLIYITPERIAEFEVHEKISEVDVLTLIKEYKSKTRVPRWPWECKYCPFAILCPFKKS